MEVRRRVLCRPCRLGYHTGSWLPYCYAAYSTLRDLELTTAPLAGKKVDKNDGGPEPDLVLKGTIKLGTWNATYPPGYRMCNRCMASKRIITRNLCVVRHGRAWYSTSNRHKVDLGAIYLDFVSIQSKIRSLTV